MESKKTPSKIALFIVIGMIFGLEFAQGSQDMMVIFKTSHDPSHPPGPGVKDANEKLLKFNHEIGTGSCSQARIKQIIDENCGSPGMVNSKIKQLFSSSFDCSDEYDWVVHCGVHSKKECYTTQEMNRLLELVLDYLKEGIKENDGNLAKFETCSKAGSIVGINMGLLIVLFITVAYFGI